MKTYTTFNTRKTPQSEAIPGTAQVENNAGGFAWAVDDWVRLDRFLILGSEGGTYYVGEKELTKRNADAVLRCINSDGKRVVDRVVEISEAGRAPKNDPALFVLAMAAGLGDAETKKAAFSQLHRVARIGTHLFHFLTYIQQFRGWGRSLREAVARWYVEKETDKLAYQVIKYRQRGGWSHRDALRKSHPISEIHNALFHWITQNEKKGELPDIITAYEKAQTCENPKEIEKLILSYNLPREAIPTEFLNDIGIWKALLNKMPMTAMIRNLGKMTNLGLLKPMGKESQKVLEAVTNREILQKARIHPRRENAHNGHPQRVAGRLPRYYVGF